MAVLSDQIENQTEKIGDLEKILDDKKEVLKKTEELLQQEMLNRSSLETTKLELMSEISGLKLKQATTEKENVELRKRVQMSLHLSDGHADGSRSLPRRPSKYREEQRDTPTRFFPLPPAAEEQRQKEQAAKAATTAVFFGRNAHIRQASAPSGGGVEREKAAGGGGGRGPVVNVAPPEPPLPHQNPIATKPKGLRKILSRMRRSNSGNLGDDKKSGEESEKEKEERNLQYRPTSSGGRLAVSGWDFQKGPLSFDPNVPFEHWNTELICSWFDTMGLYMYSNEVKRHVKTGEQLANFTSSDLEVMITFCFLTF